jgi:hypothetical protein
VATASPIGPASTPSATCTPKVSAGGIATISFVSHGSSTLPLTN